MPTPRQRPGTIHPEILAVTILIVGMVVFAVPEAFVTSGKQDVVPETEDLWVVRTAIALYQVEHDDRLPGESNALIADLLPYLPVQDHDRLANRFHPDSFAIIRDGRIEYPASQSSVRWQYDLDRGELHPWR